MTTNHPATVADLNAYELWLHWTPPGIDQDNAQLARFLPQAAARFVLVESRDEQDVAELYVVERATGVVAGCVFGRNGKCVSEALALLDGDPWQSHAPLAADPALLSRGAWLAEPLWELAEANRQFARFLPEAATRFLLIANGQERAARFDLIERTTGELYGTTGNQCGCSVDELIQAVLEQEQRMAVHQRRP